MKLNGYSELVEQHKGVTGGEEAGGGLQTKIGVQEGDLQGEEERLAHEDPGDRAHIGELLFFGEGVEEQREDGDDDAAENGHLLKEGEARHEDGGADAQEQSVDAEADGTI